MHTLRLPFTLLSVAGVWRPVNWITWQQKTAWFLFSLCTFCLILMQFLTQVGKVITATNIKEANDSLFLIPTGVSNFVKTFVFVIHRNKVLNLMKMLLKDCCIPQNVYEAKIQEKYEENIRLKTLAFLSLVNMTMLNLIVGPLLMTSDENPKLPMDVWLPYNVNSTTLYWLSYLHQSLGIFFCGIGIVGGTFMINGYLSQICGQFEIMSYRFQKLPQIVMKLQSLKRPYHLIHQYEKLSIKRNVRHHLYIFRLAKTLNEVFQPVVFQQFCFSAVAVSVSIYQISMTVEKSMEFTTIMLYLTSVLSEFFIYSWFSNELMLKSANFRDFICTINWPALSINSEKMLVFIMLRASKPIIICCGHFIVLSLSSYIGILKISYSVFNLLRTSRN